ncbi:MAG: phosphate signaling complex protein PhoU [Halobacteriota archaeon]
MPREDYQERLNELREDVVDMADLVLERFDSALTALREDDEDIAWDVIHGDAEVNEMYLDVEQACVDLIALQQPVAGDLRLIAASFKIITDLERIGDLATNLADYTVHTGGGWTSEVEVQEIGGYAAQMVEDSVRAYAEEDVDLCFEVDERDERLDEMCERSIDRVIRRLIEAGGSHGDGGVEDLMEDTTRSLVVVRDLERVGDHAVNIAARTLYMLENDEELIW